MKKSGAIFTLAGLCAILTITALNAAETVAPPPPEIILPKPADTDAADQAAPVRICDGNDVFLKPKAIAKGKKLPLIVFLHGSGSSAPAVDWIMAPLVEAWQCCVFVPTGSKGNGVMPDNTPARTWDEAKDAPEVIAKIEKLVKLHEIEPALIFLSGFSAGSTMSYVVGTEKPDLFEGIIAFSGAMNKDVIGEEKLKAAKSKLPICIVHGEQDGVENAKKTQSTLEAEGYRVKLVTFDGGHSFPDNWMDIFKDAMEWCNNPPKSK